MSVAEELVLQEVEVWYVEISNTWETFYFSE